MLLDDTKDTIYIHDLDRELEDIESKDNCLEILPGVAERMSTIPKSLVANTTSPCNELVLYTEPTSLSIPKEEDNVRKALIATRERARRIQHNSHTQGRDCTKSSTASATTSGRGTSEGPIDAYGEPMEIDVDCWGSIPSWISMNDEHEKWVFQSRKFRSLKNYKPDIRVILKCLF